MRFCLQVMIGFLSDEITGLITILLYYTYIGMQYKLARNHLCFLCCSCFIWILSVNCICPWRKKLHTKHMHKKLFHVKPARILNVRNIHLHGFKLATLRLTCLWSLNSHMYYVLNFATHILRKYFQYICSSSLFAIYA